MFGVFLSAPLHMDWTERALTPGLLPLGVEVSALGVWFNCGRANSRGHLGRTRCAGG